MIEHAIKFPKRDQTENADQRVKRKLVAGKSDDQRDRPEDNRTDKAENESRSRDGRFRFGLLKRHRHASASSRRMAVRARSTIAIREIFSCFPALLIRLLSCHAENDAGHREKQSRARSLAGRSSHSAS